MSFFKKVVDEEGNETFVEVDFTSDTELDLSVIPDDRFYEDERYKSVADRDFKRRKRLQEVEAELEAKGKTPAANEDSEDEPADSVDTTPKYIAEAEFNAELERREKAMFSNILKTLQERESEELTRKQRIQKLLNENDLPDDLIDVLEEAENPEKVAKSLARHSKKFGGGNSDATTGDSLKERLNRVNERLGLSE